MENRIELLPGVYLTALQTDKFKTGCLSVNFLQPLGQQTASANALIPSVLLRGCRQYPDMAKISAFLDQLYGAGMGTLVRKKGEIQTTGFFLDMIEDDFSLEREPVLAPMIDFMGQILQEPVLEQGRFREAFVAGERENLINTIEAQINDKRSFVMAQMLKAMCKSEAYGVARLGDEEQVRSITADSLYARYKALLAESQVELFYMGRAEQEAVAELLRLALKDLPRGKRVPAKTQVIPKAETVREICQDMAVNQGKLAMGFRTGCTAADPEYPALLLLNGVYGSGVTSKLFLHVREEQSLCYYAGSAVEKFKGILTVSSGIESENCQIAKEAILEQLDACRRGEIETEELESARRQILSSLRMAMDSPGRLDDFCLGQTILSLDGGMEQLMEAVSHVTKDQVVAAAEKLSLDTVYFLRGGAQ